MMASEVLQNGLIHGIEIWSKLFNQKNKNVICIIRLLTSFKAWTYTVEGAHVS